MPWLKRRGSRVATVDADIVHLGATAEVVRDKDKVARNVRLLHARIDSAPSDVDAYGYLAHEYIRAGRMQEAHAVVQQGWTHVEVAESGFLHRLATARAAILVARSDFAEARQTLALATRLEGDNPDLLFLAAHTAESEAMTAQGDARQSLLREACDGYRRCLSLGSGVFPEVFIKGATSWNGGTRLGIVLLLLEKPGEAREAFTRAIAQGPSERGPALGCAEAFIADGDPAAGLQRLGTLMDGGPDAWTLAGVAADALGRANDAKLFASRARAVASRGFVAQHRRAVLLRLLERVAA